MTGLFRAVKVVSREDFDLEKTFEREFEGIKKYERVSQDHAGLVDVLHVGREPNADFYYYVMELADDESGHTIDEIGAADYRPRTLASDLRKNPIREVSECISLGRSLAEALAHLHKAGLTHRDVKPSNIIFVKGEPRLADIGLVAQSGQRTYVGTEGYVPPEGPGTSSADLYSLAMVLYEMHTGKDRLEFPELPTNHELSPTVNRDEWRSLNTVICRAGSPDPRKRFESGLAFGEALRQIRPHQFPAYGQLGGGSGKRPVLGKLLIGSSIVGLVVALAAVLFLWQRTIFQPAPNEPPDLAMKAKKSPEPFPLEGTFPGGRGKKSKSKSSDASSEVKPPNPGPDVTTVKPDDPLVSPPVPVKESIVAVPVEFPTRMIKLDSFPSGATVWVGEKEIGRTPTPYREFEIGEIEFEFRMVGYHNKRVTRVFGAGDPTTVRVELLNDFRPMPGVREWSNSSGLKFVPTPVEGDLQANVTKDAYEGFLRSTGRPIVSAAKNGIVLQNDDATKWAFCDWMTRNDRKLGYLDDRQYFAPVPAGEDLPRNSFVCRIANSFGTLILNSEPSGAEIYRGDELVGKTPDTLDLRQGLFDLRLIRDGFHEERALGLLPDSDPVALTVGLKRDASVLFSQKWINTQGMPMIPVGEMMVGAYETRVSDFAQFLASEKTNGVFPPRTNFPQENDHPVVGISRGDATIFCQWLTQKERAAKMIRSWHEYRLPTDLEWSQLAGLPPEKGKTPKERDSRFRGLFPWGAQWPPVEGTGNFADVSAARLFGKYVIPDYDDKFAQTSPVGSFAPSSKGLFDIGGNAWEWVSDDYDAQTSADLGVVRGGGWDSYEQGVLLSSYRNSVSPSVRDIYYGFRYVLVDTR